MSQQRTATAPVPALPTGPGPPWLLRASLPHDSPRLTALLELRGGQQQQGAAPNVLT